MKIEYIVYIILFLIVAAILIEGYFMPRVDWTRNKRLLLWYNTKNARKYIVLM